MTGSVHLRLTAKLALVCKNARDADTTDVFHSSLKPKLTDSGEKRRDRPRPEMDALQRRSSKSP